MERFKGKMLVRRSTTTDGKPVLILCGVFTPSESIENYNDGDEMWACELGVLEAIKFDNPQRNANSPAESPEDFLAGKGQNPAEWQRRQ